MNELQARTIFPFISPEWWETLGVIGWIFALGTLFVSIMVASILAAFWSVDGASPKKVGPSWRKKNMTRRIFRQDGTITYKGVEDKLDDWAEVEQQLVREGISKPATKESNEVRHRNTQQRLGLAGKPRPYRDSDED
jgi:hypothetical protein